MTTLLILAGLAMIIKATLDHHNAINWLKLIETEQLAIYRNRMTYGDITSDDDDTLDTP